VLAAYSLATGISMPVFGRLVDKFGSAKMFVFSIAVFLIASIFCGLATDITTLSLSRVFQGIGGAGLSLLPITILSQMIPERSRPKYLAPLAAVWSVAAVAGPVVGGLLTETVGWRWIFWINLPLGLVAALLAIPAIPKLEKLREGKLFDVSTLILFIFASVSLVFALHAISEGFTDDITMTLLLSAFSLVAIIAFIWRTLKSERPIIPFKAFNNRGAITVLVIGTLGGASLFPLTGYIPTLLQMAYEVPAWLAGISLVPLVAGVLSANIFATRRLSKHGHYRHFYLLGLSIALFSMLAIYLLIKPFGVWVEVAGLALAGLGVGFYGQFTVTLAQAFSDSKFLGSVTSTVIVSRDMASSIVATFAGGLFGFGVSSALAKLPLPAKLQGVSLEPKDVIALAQPLRSQVQQAYVEAFQPIFLNSAVAYLIILLLAVSMPKIDLKAK
jgi:MFS family permease